MTITLTHNDDGLYRVQIALASLAVDGTVMVERSVQSSFNLRETVRGGLELLVSGGVGTLFDGEYAEGAENFYRVLPVDPPAGLLLTDTAGDTASTPDAAVLDVANDLRFGIDMRLDSYAPASIVYLLTKYDFTNDQRSYALRISSTGNLQMLLSSNGTSFNTAVSVAFPATGGQRVAVRGTATVDSGTGDFVATLESAPSRDGPWTQLATDTGTLSGTALHAGTAPLVVGATGDGISPCGPGTVFSAWVEDDGTAVADVDFTVQDDGDTSFVGADGLTWTVNNGARIVGPLLESDSITPSNGGQVVLKSVTHPLLNVVVRVSDYGPVEPPSRSTAFPITGRSLPTGSAELHGGRNHTLILATDDPDDFAHLDLMARVGGIFFVHVPTVAVAGRQGNVLLPGSMYVLIGQPRITRLDGVSATQHIALPLTEVNPPGPDVVGTTLTWDTIRRLYGSWTTTWAAHSAWRTVHATIGDPSDLYVP